MDTQAEFADRREKLNNKFTARIRFRDRIIGGIPAVETSDEEGGKSLLRAWISKSQSDKLSEEEIEAEVNKTFAEVYADAEEATTQTFKADDNGIYIEGRQFKAMCREAASRLGYNKPIKGQRPSLRQDLQEALHVDDARIYLEHDGTPLTEPDGYETRAIHVMGPQGPRSAIKRSAYAEQVECQCTIRILNMVKLGEEELRNILAFAQDLGLGADRSQGHGKFEVIGFEQNILTNQPDPSHAKRQAGPCQTQLMPHPAKRQPAPT